MTVAVNTQRGNSYADEPLPWLRKEDINEGLKGASSGAALGTIETGIWKDGRRIDVNKDNIPSTRYLSFL